jgi:hypothetical protein
MRRRRFAKGGVPPIFDSAVAINDGNKWLMAEKREIDPGFPDWI